MAGFAGVVLVLAGDPASGQVTGINPKHLVGGWRPADAPPDDTTAYIFEEDGTFFLTQNGEGGSLRGTYKLDGHRLTVRYKLADKSEKTAAMIIHRLTPDALILTNEKGNKGRYDRFGMA